MTVLESGRFAAQISEAMLGTPEVEAGRGVLDVMDI